jgi:hypothetical protein
MKNLTLYTVVKTETDIKGYWIDNGKVYIDNIRIVDYSDYTALRRNIQTLFNTGEKAVFYSLNNIGYCEYADGKKSIYIDKYVFTVNILTDSIIQELLKTYGGFTAYKYNGFYLIEVYKTI